MVVDSRLALAVFAIAVIAFVVFSVLWLRAVALRARSAYGWEQANATQRLRVATTQWALSGAALVLGIALVTVSGPTLGTQSTTADQGPPVIFYLNSPTPSTRVAAPLAQASTALPMVTAAPVPTQTPAAQPSATLALQTPTATAQPPTAAPRATPTPAPTAARTRTPTPLPSPTTAQAIADLPRPDCIDPGTVGILSPAHGETMTGQRAVIVNAGFDSGGFAKLEALNSEGNWAYIARSDTGIRNGQIASIDASQFAPGVRQLRLVVVDSNQRETKTCRIAVVIR